MNSYEKHTAKEVQRWQQKMQETPSLFDKISKGVQDKVNAAIPEKVHKVITLSLKKMIEMVIFGAKFTTSKPLTDAPLLFRDIQADEKLSFYRRTATTEGAITGAGGILLGLADFPLLIGIKIKFLYDVAAVYGFDVGDYKERLYILYIFQLTFSSRKRRREVFQMMENWEEYAASLPDSPENFDWRIFQQEYRDYIDLVKMAQLIPFIGAAVGAIANYKLLNQLGDSAKNAYRMRLLKQMQNS